MADAARVLVVGCSGSGKSTFFSALSVLIGAPHIAMDHAFFWLPGWTMRPRPEIRELVGLTVERDRWIIDGSSPGTLDLRLPRADIVVFFRLPVLVCLSGVVGRWLRYRGRTRPHVADGCPEKIDMEFLRYIWNFERKETPEIMAMIECHKPEIPVVMLKSRRQADALLAALARNQ